MSVALGAACYVSRKGFTVKPVSSGHQLGSQNFLPIITVNRTRLIRHS